MPDYYVAFLLTASAYTCKNDGQGDQAKTPDMRSLATITKSAESLADDIQRAVLSAANKSVQPKAAIRQVHIRVCKFSAVYLKLASGRL